MAHLALAFLECIFIFFYIRGSFCQRDCTGVDCPQLENCIEEVLERGACCASCLQKGCTCEGYQYYDCVNAGFKNGKVPQGEAYFVDYGSTECSCPAGGGRISCHFISCPEMPPNCIDFSEPADGCMQCERVGCIHDGQKYEAGHSFHVDTCRVCHCPNEGGKPMCYPVPNCDPNKVQKPMLAGPSQEEPDIRNGNSPYMFDQQDQMGQLPTPYHLPSEGNLPLFKAPAMDNDELEEYDYGPTEFPDTYPQSFAVATQSASFNKVKNSLPQGADRISKQELREKYGVHNYPAETEEEPTEIPPEAEQSTVQPQDYEDATASWKSSKDLAFTDLTDFKYPLNAHKHFGTFILPLNRDLGSEKQPQDPSSHNSVHLHESTETMTHDQNSSDTATLINSGSPMNTSQSQNNEEKPLDELKFPLYSLKTPVTAVPLQNAQATATPDTEELFEEEYFDESEDIVTLQNVTAYEGYNVLYNVKAVQQATNHKESESRVLARSFDETTPEPTASFDLDSNHQTTTTVYLSTTTQPLSSVKQDDKWTSQKANDEVIHFPTKQNKPHKVIAEEERNDRSDLHHKSEGGADEGLVQSCCAAGQTWAKQKDNCDHLPVLNSDRPSICSVAQKQCCLSSVKEVHCESGLTAARAGQSCDAHQDAQCADDSHQVCCSCCALGLQVRSEGLSCEAHQFLGFPCGHIFLTCCEEDPAPSQTLIWSKQKPRPTAEPRQVLDSPFFREAFSIAATEEAANALEDDVDECQMYPGQLCQHTCTNIWGSYRCGCHRGYILQHDGHSCAPVSPDEDNRLTEDDDSHLETTTSATTSTTTTISPVFFNPCADSRCSQQCSVIGGRARCSCFPGYSLRTDGHTCQDVDECATLSHSCGPSERCRNTVGSFVCEQLISCPPGHQLNNGLCEDIDECVRRTHNCGGSFVCENTPGSFRCRPKLKCITGFTQDSHGNCIDINECSSLTNPCSSGTRCINTVGSYTCQKKTIMCSHGYHANAEGDKCVDVDECQVGTHRCGAGQICHNLPGTYRCECQTGYQYDSLRKVCNDVNECWRFPGRLCSQTCDNTPGSYQCSCTTGFSLAPDGKNCEDLNECDRNPCSQECANIYGSYQCYCREGYFLKEDGHTCEDIDECSQSMGNLCAFKCVNVVGSYQCACPPHGYIMAANGRTCKDVDECTTGSHNCSIGQSCFNLQGGFRCLSFDCPHNYKKVTDTRCERVSCPSNSLDCQNSPVRITYYQLSFQTNIIIPAQIFRIGPSPAYSGDHIVIRITKGNDEGYFSTRKLNSHTGAVYLHRQVREPRDFVIDVEMRLLRQGAFTSFLAKIYVFITSSSM